MARCPHNNVQQFTEVCLDCGRNIYETDEEYYRYLKGRVQSQQQRPLSDEIERMEKQLGIRHAGNNQPDTTDNYGYGGPVGGW